MRNRIAFDPVKVISGASTSLKPDPLLNLDYLIMMVTQLKNERAEKTAKEDLQAHIALLAGGNWNGPKD